MKKYRGTLGIALTLLAGELGTSFASAGAPVPGKLLTVVAEESAVTFTAIGKPSALKIVGKATGPTGTASVEGGRLQGEFRFDLSKLQTGLSLRDTHMKDKYLEVGKFPEAVLKLSGVPLAAGQKNLDFTGTLTLHGVEKPIRGQASLEQSGNEAKVVSDFELKTSDFNIAVPTFAGITVTDLVKVNVTLTARSGAKSGP